MDSFYGIKMQVFLLILEVCILVCASIIHGSAGNDVAWSPANFPSGPPDKGRTRSFVYHQRPSLPPLQDEYDIARSPANSPASPENKRAPGFAYHEEAPRVSNPSPPSPVDGPTVHSSMSSAPASESSDGPVQSIPSIPRTALPPRNLATPPKTLQRLSPHIPSRTYSRTPDISPVTMPLLPEPAVIPISAPPPSTTKDQRRRSVATPPKETSNHLVPMNRSQSIGASSPLVSPATKRATKSGHFATPPSKSFPKPLPGKWFHRPASSPSISFNEHNYSRAIATSPVPAPPLLHPATPFQQDTAKPPAPSQSSTLVPRKNWQRHHNPPQMKQGPSVSPSLPFPPSRIPVSPVASPSLPVPSGRTRRVLPPTISPIGSYAKKPVTPLPSQVLALPPPPPNRDCTSIVCVEPLTNTPPGSPCSCVQPMQVGLQLNVAIYTFFPLVSELAFEIASGIFMKQSQVRIIGANAVSQQLDKTIVLIDLVPLGTKFDAATALLTFERFWHKKVVIKSSFFGEYDVLYVHYPGLPPSPPSTPLSVSAIDGGPHFGQDNSAQTIHPLGVDVRKKQKDGLGRSMIAVIVLSSSIAMGIVIGAAWLLIPKGADRSANHNRCLPKPTTQTSIPSSAKPTAFESGPSSAGLSFGSSIAAYTGSAKTFTLGEMERATDNFDASKLLGEGGFGRVYRGVLDDGTTVAIKVLKRDDQQGGREFMAEVEMLSRLHHRNLVKLIGICIEGNARCLVYELVPNGSVESHLHGVDKESGPLDWGARMKIALGAARGLAYLHEDSSPRVIHRDFKASNILLEDDYTPKVSDFGLARTALDEESKHISTRVMGTFGYVAPEYAMTGHLLVKSDVYSYGVVLLELLTGRKPVDMSQPLGQENLVAWARPLLTSKEGLEIIIDPSLGSNFPLDCIAKVAAIASMCVQPEVSHRPFMGEVVQALKLVCEESNETRELGSESCCSRDDASNTDKDVKVATPMFDYSTLRSVLSASDRFDTSTRFGRQVSGSFRRHSSSGPLRSWRRRRIWDRVRGVSRGSVSEHGFAFKFWGRSH